MTEQCVERIRKEHEGWEARDPGMINGTWIKVLITDGTTFWGKFEGMNSTYCTAGPWTVRPPAPREPKPSERLCRIMGDQPNQTQPSFLYFCELHQILDEQHERAKK